MFLKQWRAVIAPIFSGAKLGKYFCIHKRAAAHSQHRGTFKPFSQGFVSELITDGEVPALIFHRPAQIVRSSHVAQTALIADVEHIVVHHLHTCANLHTAVKIAVLPHVVAVIVAFSSDVRVSSRSVARRADRNCRHLVLSVADSEGEVWTRFHVPPHGVGDVEMERSQDRD